MKKQNNLWWYKYHKSKNEEFSNRINGIDIALIDGYFLLLPKGSREVILKTYGRLHGDGAESYLRQHYFAYRNNKRIMSVGVRTKLLSALLPRAYGNNKIELLKAIDVLSPTVRPVNETDIVIKSLQQEVNDLKSTIKELVTEADIVAKALPPEVNKLSNIKESVKVDKQPPASNRWGISIIFYMPIIICGLAILFKKYFT